MNFLEHACQTKPTSFHILLKEGPFIAGHPLTDFWLSQNDFKLSWEYLFEYPRLSRKERKESRKVLEKKPFCFSWLAYLSHFLASSYYYDSYTDLKNEPLFFHDIWYGRYKTERFYHESFAEKQKVLVLNPIKPMSSFRLGKVKKIKFDDLGEIEAQKLVISLNENELKDIGFSFQTPYKKQKPLLFWSKMSLKSSCWQSHWGERFLWLHNKDFSWTHENLCVIQNLGDRLEVWLRLPYCFQYPDYRDRLLSTQSKFLETFQKKIPVGNLKVLKELELVRSLPVYRREEKKQKMEMAYGVWWDSVELSRRLDWKGRFDHQEKIIEEMGF